jgi:hypothetical protein
MKLVRRKTIRVLAVLVYACAFAFLPVPWADTGLCVALLSTNVHANPSRASSAECSCPMCHTAGGGPHHCTCCQDGRTCTCSASSGEDESKVTLVFESAVLPDADELHLKLPSSHLIVQFSQPANDTCLSIPTPPPRSSF